MTAYFKTPKGVQDISQFNCCSNTLQEAVSEAAKLLKTFYRKYTPDNILSSDKIADRIKGKETAAL